MPRRSKPGSRSAKKQTPPVLTPRQIQILRLIARYRHSNGCSPTMREMAEQLQLSKVTVFEHVEALVQKELLCREPNRARSLMLNPQIDFDAVLPAGDMESEGDVDAVGEGVYPLAGAIAAGMPLEAIEGTDNLDLRSMFETAGETYALKVRGDSMIEEHICDGDYVLVRKTSRPARDGQIVVAVLEDGEATLKRLYREKKGFRLQPANPAFQPLYVERLEVRGVVIGIVRRCSLH